MLVVPLKPVASQTLSASLGNQNCAINVYQKFTGLFLDLYVDNALVIASVICENANRIVRSNYLGFSGDLVFYDTQGSSDPEFSGLGSRFILTYLDPTELSLAA